MKNLRSLLHMVTELHTEEDCRRYLEEVRWGDTPACPHCGSVSEQHYLLRSNGQFRGWYKCRDCRSKFTVTVGTMFEGSHIPLKKWFMAIYVFLSHKKGISSMQLHRDVEVTQKTAWFMLHRIRHNFEDRIDVVFESETQVDETYVGGKNRGRKRGTQGRSLEKTPVMGLLSEGKVVARVIPNASGDVLKEVIYGRVLEGSTVVSDGWVGYKGLSRDFIHVVVNHSEGEYVKDGYHTNSVEGFWSQLKRGIIGIYHVVSRKHLPMYCEEFAYRYNTREVNDGVRFHNFLAMLTNRLHYWELISPF